nr:vegetative cell wall protein gp1-like [Lolium perenne]
MRPLATSATSSSAPKGRKRPCKRTTAQLEAKLKKQRRAGPKKVPEAAGAPIKFSKGGGSRPTPSIVSPLQWQRREPTPQPTPRARTPPIVVPPGLRPELAGAASAAAGADGPTPDVVVLDASSDEAPPAPESAIPTGPTASTVPPPSSEPAREEPAGQEPARLADADARALVTAKGPAQPSSGLHVSPTASMLNVVSASYSSLGSAGTMEKDWHQADACEVTSREGCKGVAPVEMFFSDFRAFTKA